MELDKNKRNCKSIETDELRWVSGMEEKYRNKVYVGTEGFNGR